MMKNARSSLPLISGESSSFLKKVSCVKFMGYEADGEQCPRAVSISGHIPEEPVDEGEVYVVVGTAN